MRPLPLRPRIIAALELAPMTRQQLARVLCAKPSSVHRTIDELRAWRLLVCTGVERAHKGKGRQVWGLA